jgi:hypothetical protein
MGGGFFKGTISNVKVDPMAAQETKKRIEITHMNRTIKKMQNEITILRRGYNYVENPRMPIPKKRKNPPQENRVRFENTNNPQRSRVPRQPTPNVVVLDDVYDEKIIEQENYYSPEKFLKLCRWTDARRPCIYLKRVTTIPTHKNMSPKQEDL